MSPDVASTVLTDLRRTSSKGGASEEDIAQIDRQTRAQFTEQSDPYFATSRLWDDGIIEPQQTREVIGLCLAIIATQPPVEGMSPVFRM
jgi:3-methylcrotonyl-CoA carboxylase beta subunit